MQLSSIARPAARARTVLALTALTLAAACGGQGDKSDAALRNDLSLTGKPGTAQQVVSPQELTPGAAGAAAPVAGAVGPNGAPTTALAPTTPAPTPAPQVIERERIVYRDRPTHHHSSSASSSGGSGTYSSGTTVHEAAPQPTVRTSHTKNGAIIGGAAGAAIGIATSHDKLKGGLLGAVLGGAAGAVIGNNSGVKHEPAQP